MGGNGLQGSKRVRTMKDTDAANTLTDGSVERSGRMARWRRAIDFSRPLPTLE
jgi:hypothetical protein